MSRPPEAVHWFWFLCTTKCPVDYKTCKETVVECSELSSASMILVNDTVMQRAFCAVFNLDLIVSTQERAAHTTPSHRANNISWTDRELEWGLRRYACSVSVTHQPAYQDWLVILDEGSVSLSLCLSVSVCVRISHAGQHQIHIKCFQSPYMLNPFKH